MADELALESASASRQKSCNACVKAKRGCDKRHPTCSRCDDRQIPCVYTKRSHYEAFQNGFDFDFDSVPLDTMWERSTQLSSSKSPNNILDPAILPDLDTGQTISPSFSSFRGPFFASPDFYPTTSRDMQLMNSIGVRLGEPQQMEQALSSFDYTPMADICMQYEPWQVYDPTTKVHYFVQTIKSYPATFARDNHTAWMHRYLYKDQMPSSVQSCFTASSLYSNMTSDNKTSVFRVLCKNLDELKQQQFANTPQEKLARVQALFLYQVICVFDGDLTLRSNADRDMPLLQGWVDELCKIRENLKPRETVNTDETRSCNKVPRSWEWWIFAESVRRTIVIAYAFLGMWMVMSKNNDDSFVDAWKYQHCWTISRALWEAPSSFYFYSEWKSRAHHVNENFEFDEFLKSGRADDVDDFSKLLMVAYMGVDETKQWFSDHGSKF